MKLTIALLGAGGLAVLAAVPAAAAPAVMAGARGPASTETSVVEQVGYRRCYVRNGRRVCRWVDEPLGSGISGRVVRPESYSVGTTDWWRAMDQEGRGGFRR